MIEPQRRCVACRRSAARSVLLRFAVAEDDGVATVVHDPCRTLPGRGAWLHPDPDCWTLARRRSALTRVLRTGARIDQVGIDAVFAALRPTAPPSTQHDLAPEPGSEPPTSPPPSARTRATGSGSDADEHPMSTQR